MPADKNRYQSYLIRFTRHDHQHPWRVTIEEAGSNQVYHFPSEAKALLFLLQQVTNVEAPAPTVGG